MAEPDPPTRFLSDADVRSVFDWPAAVQALRVAYAAADAPARYPARSMARGDRVWLRTLSGVPADGSPMGAKLIAASMRRGRAAYLIPLFDQDSVALLGLLDGNAITGFRTAATSALAVQCVARSGALDVAVIGSGFEARHHLEALAAVRTVARARVYSPNPASRERFIAQLRHLGVPIAAADSASAALRGADVVLCAARARDESPTLRGEWLESGMTVVSIGSTLPEQREVDASVIARADLIMADTVEEVAHDTGDMLAAVRDGVHFEGKMVALADVVAGRHVGRQDAGAIVLYKSVGSGIQDLAVAAMCLARATVRNIGTVLPITITPVEKGR